MTRFFTRSDDWAVKVDLINDLLLAVWAHIHAGNTGGATTTAMQRVPEDEVYDDPLMMMRLPRLVSALMEAFAFQKDGEGSLRQALEQSSNFIAFHGGLAYRAILSPASPPK